MRTWLAAAIVALAIPAAAAAQWTPQKPGDPRQCPNHTPAQCATAAAGFAFKAKYIRVNGRPLVNTLRCSQTVSLLEYNCVWGTHQTPVRFSRAANGWVAAVGAITSR